MNDTQSKHTQTPWAITEVLPDGHCKINSPGRLVCIVGNGENSPNRFFANAEFIVRAVNSYDDMLKALEAFSDGERNGYGRQIALDKARAAITESKETLR